MAKKVIGIDQDSRSSIAARESDGWVAEKVNRKQFNQILYQSITDHVWGTENQVKSSNTADMYTNGAGATLNANDAAVTIGIDDRILINHDVTQTANLLLDCGGVKVNIEMYDGATLDMDTFDLTLGVTAGDEFSGSIRVISDSSAEELTVLESSGLRIDTGMSVVNLAGDVVVNNTLSGISSANIDAKDLKIEYTSASTVTITADSLKLVSDDNQSVVVNNISEVPDISNVAFRQNSAGELSDAWYNIEVGATSGQAIEILYVPVLEATTDGTTAFELVDSSEDFTTHLNAIGDKVFNNTTGEFAFVTAVTNAATGRLLLDGDIFTSGDEYTIELRSPTFSNGYTFKALVGRVYNNTGNFDNAERVLWYLGQKEYAQFRDVKSNATAGGSSVAGSDQIRTLNVLKTNMIGVSLSSNQLILPCRDYDVDGHTPFYLSNKLVAWLYNITDSSIEISGSTEDIASTAAFTGTSRIKKQILVAAQKFFEVQYRCTTGRTTDGLGIAASVATGSSTDSIFTDITFRVN